MKLSDYIPALRFGAKIMPEDIAGMIGLPSVGNIFYVDPTAGSDTANNGKSVDNAYATAAKALSSMSADNDDILVIAGTGSTGRTAESAVIDWNKRRTHIIGNSPARRMTPRNGIGANYGGGSTTPVFKVSANNCSFSNLTFASFADNDILVEVTSDYNTFNNCHFQGIAHATPASEAGARSLLLTDAEENEFNNCTIGIDTVTRAAANASLELTGSCPRNQFRGCLFPVYTSNAGAFWVKADTGNAFERFLVFEDCLFTNATLGSSTVMTVGFDLSTTGNGQVYFKNSRWYGATDLVNNVTDLINDSPVFDTNDQGLMGVHANS